MKTRTTTADIADLVEFSINEAKPQVKTRRGVGNEIEIKIAPNTFLITVSKPKTEDKKTNAKTEHIK